MIKAISWNGNLCLLGISRENCSRLLEGKPILVAPERLPGLRQFVLLVAGETEEDLVKQFEHLLPPGATAATDVSPGEEVRVTAQGVERLPAADPDEVAKRAVAGELERLRARVHELEAAARHMLGASEPGVPETQGVGRVARLAKLVGYNPGKQDELGMPPATSTDFDRMAREMERLGDLLRIEVEQTSPGWTFSLLLYQARADPQNGPVLHIAHDRENALAAVSKWVWERLEAKKAAAAGRN